MKNPFIKIISYCTFACTALFTAAALSSCGDDSSSNKAPEFLSEIADEDEELDSSSSGSNDVTDKDSTEKDSIPPKKEVDIPVDKYVDSTLLGEKFDSNIGTLDIVKGSIYDSTYDREYKTVKIGPYVWMAENLEFGKVVTDFGNFIKNDKEINDLCYGNDEKNCKSGGRLFRNLVKDAVCPEGFYIPSIADYKYLMKVSKDIADQSFGFAPQMAGFCKGNSKSIDSITCDQKDKSAYLLTKDKGVFNVASNGEANIKVAESNGYYSLRCMKLTSFVEDEKKLPICDEQSVNDLDYFYVADKGVNYICDGTQWIKDRGKKCTWSDMGENRYYKDTLFACKNGVWTPARIEDTDLKCTSDMAGDVYDLNGIRYVCNRERWAEITDIEKAIGICSPKNLFATDTVYDRGSARLYVCRESGWIIPRSVEDLAGKCDSTKLYEIVDYKEYRYACREYGSWITLSNAEKEYGICHPGIHGKMDTTENNSVVVCDSTGWRIATAKDLYGACEPSRNYEVVDVGSYKYACRTTGEWTSLSITESAIGVCNPEKEGVIDTSVEYLSTKYYICDNGVWRIAGMVDYIGECTAANKGSIGIYGVTPYLCDSSWRTATQDEYPCTENLEGEVNRFGSKDYGCVNLTWRELTSKEKIFGLCWGRNLDEKASQGDSVFFCRTNGWTYINPDVDYGRFTDSRDGQVYETVNICSEAKTDCQTWMAQNLNYAYKGVKYNHFGSTSDSSSWCIDNEISNCDKFGRLYTWGTVMDSAAQFSENAGTRCGNRGACTPNSPHRGICPEGWHVPTKEEFSTLYNNVGGITYAGRWLKSTSGWVGRFGSGNGRDKYGFTLIFVGYRDDKEFHVADVSSRLWTASESENGSWAWSYHFDIQVSKPNASNDNKYYGQSLRCVKD